MITITSLLVKLFASSEILIYITLRNILHKTYSNHSFSIRILLQNLTIPSNNKVVTDSTVGIILYFPVNSGIASVLFSVLSSDTIYVLDPTRYLVPKAKASVR